MDIALLYFDGCPNWRETDHRLQQALRQQGLDPSRITYTQVHSPEQAERLSFHGSPTVLINGLDPFSDTAAAIGLTCRLYRTPDGLRGAPTVEQLAGALDTSRGTDPPSP